MRGHSFLPWVLIFRARPGQAGFFLLPRELAMPILIVLIAFVALIYGAVKGFYALSAMFGVGVAIGVAVFVAVVIVGAVVYWWRRRREVAANVHDGDWTHELKEDWGFVRLAAGKRFCEIKVDGGEGSYIFADLVGVEVLREEGRWKVAVKVKDARQGVWVLPMVGERQARKWKRIFGLAVEQRL
jgi:hypothetical protein